ncbi:threonine aldolase family protein [Crocinitomix catalasitica]|uniref:threonine aldolase family protein n=1 Tax=Crocinitomix catalasitica TaxID=184607 RepID=UPI000488D1AC|nr:GntG family PLP-dependent aldolase [Crocinitomix catalasitica]
MRIVDFRSDTVTKPSIKMRGFMLEAEVGDDVFGDDPSINELQNYAAKKFGKEAALYCASGTMTNQIAIMTHCSPGDELICHEESHIYRYEGGGIARNAQTSVRLLRGNNGRIEANQIPEQINPFDPHYPITRLVSIEDTANRGGGRVYDFEEIKRIKLVCDELNLKLHLDGARVFNALTINNIDPLSYGKQFDTISICLSKGLGAPVGSLLLGTKEFIAKAHRIRKVLGGGMRQAGIIAAGGLFALKNNIKRLNEDHSRAKKIGNALTDLDWVKVVWPVETNIVVVEVKDNFDEYEIVEDLKKSGILCVTFGKGRIRFTTHLDIDDNDVEFLINHFKKHVQK